MTTTARRSPAWPRSCWHAGWPRSGVARRRQGLHWDVALVEFEPEFERWGMVTDGIEEVADDGAWQA